MHAIVIGPQGELLWDEVPDVTPAATEVLVRVTAAGVNRADLLQAAGLYPPPPGTSNTLGLEVSGTVVALGSAVSGWSLGDPVCALLAGGGYAEYVTVPAGQLAPIPDGVPLVDAAGLPEVAATVWSNLVMTAGLHAGQLVLLHGGASGVGSHAIQVAKALDAVVAVTAGSPEKLATCAELGADITINYREDDFVAVLAERGGADLILDIMGAAYLDRNIDALAVDGQLIVIGMQGGVKGELNLGKLITKRARVIGTGLRGRSADAKAAVMASVVEHVWPMVADGRVRTVIGERLPITEAGTAHAQLASGVVTGKIVLTV